MTMTIELPDDLAEKLRSFAAQHGQDPGHYVAVAVAEALSHEGQTVVARPWSQEELLSLPIEERNRILSTAAEAMAPFYEESLALPVDQQELTMFMTMNHDPVLEPDEYLTEEKTHNRASS